MNSLLIIAVAAVVGCFAHHPEPHPPQPQPNPTTQACFLQCQSDEVKDRELCHKKCIRAWIGQFKDAEMLEANFCIYQVGQLAYNSNIVIWNYYMSGEYSKERFDRYLEQSALVTKVEMWAKYNCRDHKWHKDETPEMK